MKWTLKYQIALTAVLVVIVAFLSFLAFFHKPFQEDTAKAQTESVDVTKEQENRLKPEYEHFVKPDLFDKNHILAYYGHPKSKIMGIVGRHSKEELARKLKAKAEVFKKISGEKGVIPALYLIYATCQPKGEILRMKQEMVESYIKFSLDNGFLVYLDHQIGKHKPETAFKELLPFLKYPNVHLAIDVEWRTDKPMKKIGYITAFELNKLQEMMRDYMTEHQIPGKRQLVFHQFKPQMVVNIESVKASYDPVILIHATSGWGPPSLKRSTHAKNAKVNNIPNKAFKLWYYFSDKKGVHYDQPLMSPGEVLALVPQPSLIIYQ